MARTQSKHYPEIRENILKQAAGLFAEQGYAGTTIIDLARACGSSRGALYHYFESKEEILFHILQDHVDRLDRLVQEAIRPGDSAEAQFRAIVRTIVLSNAESQNEQTVLLNDLGQLSEAQQRGIVATQRKITEVVSDTLIRMDSGHRLTPRNKKAYTMMLFGMVNYTLTWYDPKGPVSPEAYAEMTADVFTDGFVSR